MNEMFNITTFRENQPHFSIALKLETKLPTTLIESVFGPIHPDTDVFALEHAGYTMLQKGQWKITNSARPFNEADFELFDLSSNMGEQHDLKKADPAKYRGSFYRSGTLSPGRRACSFPENDSD
ncbi:MAG: hypothetical protein E4H26_05945 [Flavobacteriales bacterium]|nr:MAG: hypothetical protein E4H26_05945 [Flavobacteriales bacterium]